MIVAFLASTQALLAPSSSHLPGQALRSSMQLPHLHTTAAIPPRLHPLHRCSAVRCQAEPELPAAPSQLPAGWTSEVDPATNAVYYIDQVNLVSQWEVPTNPAEPAAPAVLQQQQQQPIVSRSPEAEETVGGASLLGGMISADQNPYVRSKADRMREKFGSNVEGVMSEAYNAKRSQLEDSLAADLARFKADNPSLSSVGGEPTMLNNIINTLGKILTVNFFIIIGLFGWFLTGVALKFGAQSEVVIDAFRGSWDLFIMPLLTTHMTLTFLSAGLERIGSEKEA